MPKFGPKSIANLATCHGDLKLIALEVIPNMDFSCVEGHRGKELQNAYYNGNPRLSFKEFPDGTHNKIPSMAAHFIPYPDGWKNLKEMILLAGMLLQAAAILLVAGKISHKLRWGGDWDMDKDLDDQQWDDLAHYELREIKNDV